MIPLFGPVGPELLVILGLLVLLFGAKRIPRLANSVGRSLGSFKKGRQEIEEELKEAEDDVNSTIDDARSDVHEATSEVEKQKNEAKDAVTPDVSEN